MAQSVVQTKTFVVDSSTTTTNVSFNSLPSLGNAVRVIWGNYGGNVTTVADNQGGSNTYGAADASVQHGTSSNTRAFAFSCNKINASSGTFTVTISSNSGDYLAGVLVEESGSLDTSPLDRSDTEQSSTTSITPTTLATTEANEISYVIATGADNGNNPHGYALPGDYTQLFLEDNAASHMAAIVGYKLLSATGVQNPTVSWTNNDLVVGIVVTYKASAAAGILLPHISQRPNTLLRL
jgi:hypothetical protein